MSVAKKEEDCQQTGGLLGGERGRLKRVSNHDIPVLTPQLFKRENSPVASGKHHLLATSGEMLRLGESFGTSPERGVVPVNDAMLHVTSPALLIFLRFFAFFSQVDLCRKRLTHANSHAL